LGVLAGTDMPLDQLAAICKEFDFIIAADGAANRLLEIDVHSNVVVGDMDSATPAALDFAKSVESVPDQDRSDCDKLLAYAAACDFGQITLTNVEGDRPDHFLSTLASCARSVVETRLIFRRGRGVVLRGPIAHSIEVQVGWRVSLLPLTECVGVKLDGVFWPLDQDSLSAHGLVSLSNVATHSVVHVDIAGGSALLVWSDL
jgi:thiamine pyrophosphokinase